ncbi:pleckstrin domain-containing protein [Cavenderia fasciculata]|uniref:Pleckstrin domain-containing protein n=1 Tax=Cavenderia fasciculata TaxID=261658 RepID=F4Q697_CACFS|nr:pleckstrin domain-containing protein [Cavenderia fasciculata]EGG17471.1 pleckstrin domain-containing protein [Cavenderia fasciculata]|eukprot:XP_004355955.1 pleckstrin domain-containing protein [Cavenderia fasciculata]
MQFNSSSNNKPPVKGWINTKASTTSSIKPKPSLDGIESLSAFLQKQSNKATIPKIYKKKWVWFSPNDGCLYYYQSGATSTTPNSSNNTTTAGYQIKTIPIDNATIEQSPSIRLEFIVSTIPTQPSRKRQLIFRAADEATVLNWVNVLTTWKSNNNNNLNTSLSSSTSTSSSTSSPSSPTSILPPSSSVALQSSISSGHNPYQQQSQQQSPAPSPIRSHNRARSYGGDNIVDQSGNNTSWVNSPPSPPNELNESFDDNLSPVKKQSADNFLKNLVSLEPTTQQQSRSSYSSVKIRQLLLRHQPTLDNDQTNYVLTQIHQQISYLQECYNEILFVSNSQGGVGGQARETILFHNGGMHPLSMSTYSSSPSSSHPISPSNSSSYLYSSSTTLSSSTNSSGGGVDEIDLTYSSLSASGGSIHISHHQEDIFSLLPNHLSIYIFSYLSPEELLKCSQVTRQWKLMSSDNSLWIRFTQHLATPASIFDPTQNWKRTYLNHRKQSLLGKKEKILNRAISLYGITPTSTNNNHTVKEGYLYKRGEDILKIWKKRYFVLKENCLFYFQHSNDNFPNGMIPLNRSIKLVRVPNSTRKHCFKIIHDGSSKHGSGSVERREPYFLSSENDDECNEWMKSIQNVLSKVPAPPTNNNNHENHSSSSSSSSKHHHTLKKGKKSTSFTSPPNGLNTQQPQQSLSGSTGNPIQTPVEIIKPLFGIPLAAMMVEQAKGSVFMGSELPMPWILHKCFNHILENGVYEEGIFRISGSMVEIERLKSLFEQGRDVDLSQADIHAVTGIVKYFFRKLPHHLIPPELSEYATSISLAQTQTLEEKLREYKFIFESLDSVTYSLMKCFLLLLKHIVENQSYNKMTEENMLTCIMPTINCSPVLVTNAIRHYQELFP